VVLAFFLRRYDLDIIHVYLVHSVVKLSAIELSEDVFTKLIVSDKIACFVLSDKFVKVCINGHVVLHERRPEVIDVS